jgi:hypothetical protein
MDCGVNTSRFVTLCLTMALSCGGTLAQQEPSSQFPLTESKVATEAVPPQVVASAVAAVAKLGDDVVLGRYQVAVERMNPIWRERTAKRSGSTETPEQQAAGVAAQMVQQGISMISCKPQGQPRPYEVAPGTVAVKENGATVEKLMFTKWLVLVPTATRFRIMHGEAGQPPKVITIESISYQVAISDKGKNDWTFIDGSQLQPSDLRGLFVTLPKNMELPPVEKHESR